ncbi:hypothetical protein ACKVV1_011444 [Pyricularia oryzae]
MAAVNSQVPPNAMSKIEGDTYPVLRTEKESARLFSQLGLISQALGGLVQAPVDLSQPNLRILDVGAGTGRWLSMVQESMTPSARATATLQGTDIAPYPDCAPGISIELHSFKNPFPEEWEASFDLVHMGSCLMMSPGDEAPRLVARLARLVKPGGWLQLSDAAMSIDPVGETDKPHERLYKTMGKCVRDMGMDPTQGGRLTELLGAAGADLAEVASKAAPIKIGKTASEEMESQTYQYIDMMFGNLLHAAQVLNLEGIPELKEEVLDEARTKGFDFMFYAAWGRRD